MNAAVHSAFGYVSSTIGSKKFVALTGLGWSLFLLTHMAGNLLIFVGPDTYNTYGYKIVSNPLLILAEAGLLGALLVHVVFAAAVTIRNRSSRSSRYAMAPNGPKRAKLGSRTMIYQGVIILTFIILHLITFKFGPHYETVVDGQKMRDLFRLMTEVFHKPAYVAWYIVALLILSLHLNHGVFSCFQSLGLNNEKWDPLFRKIALGFTIVVILGFMAQPLFMFCREI